MQARRPRSKNTPFTEVETEKFKRPTILKRKKKYQKRRAVASQSLRELSVLLG